MDRVHFVGNVMIDSLLASLDLAVPPGAVFADNGLDTALLAAERGFGLVTLHRPSNVDQHGSLAEALAILREISRKLPLIWPLHPRTRASIDRLGRGQAVDARRTFVLPPQGYLETLGLIKDATLVITDSGGIQEETTALGVPCLTMRENTERPVTVEVGTNELVGTDPARAVAAARKVLAGRGKQGRVPELWDGRAAERVAEILVRFCGRREQRNGGRG